MVQISPSFHEDLYIAYVHIVLRAADLEGCPGGLVVLEEVAVDGVDCAELSNVLHQHRGLHQPSAVTLSGGGSQLAGIEQFTIIVLLFNVLCSLPSKA